MGGGIIMGDRYSDALSEIAYADKKAEVSRELKSRLMPEYYYLENSQWDELVNKVAPTFRFRDVDAIEAVSIATKIMFNEE